MGQNLLAGEGQIWICSACGREKKDRNAFGDVSCYLHAVLCIEESIVRDEVTGFVKKADVVLEESK